METTKMDRLPGKFVWFEHFSPDPAKARGFYESLFGWRCLPVPMGDGSTYEMILLDDRPESAMGGYRAAPAAGAPPQWLSYLSVEDVDASHAAVLAAGGRSVMAPVDYGPFGRGAVVTDPAGAAFALWRGAAGDPPDTKETPPGGWHWNELMTGDDAAALAFYERVFGYSHESVPILTADGGTLGTYHLLKDARGVPRAGAMKSPDPGAPPRWLQYVHVDDCDASAERARGLGAEILMAPTEIPGVGRFAVLRDPVGAAIAVMKPVPYAG